MVDKKILIYSWKSLIFHLISASVNILWQYNSPQEKGVTLLDHNNIK